MEDFLDSQRTKFDKEIKDLFIILASKNYKDFFKRLNTKFGRNMFCEYLQPWIRDFMSKLDLERYFFMEWEIPVKEIYNFNVIIKDYKRIDDGGGITNRRNITNKLKGRRRWIYF